MHVLSVTTLYPNPEQIRNGIFVRERLQKLVEQTDSLRVTVLAPVPWFPFRSARFGRYATFARVPRAQRDGCIEVYHPRFLQIPKIGSLLAPLTYFLAVARCIRRQRLSFDLIDAHFAFPDGVASVLLGAIHKVPVSITVRGSDVIHIARERIAGRWIRWSFRRASRVIAVSRDLACRVARMAPEVFERDPERVCVIRNGVDLERFRPGGDSAEAKRALQLNGFVVLSVGNLIPLKGHDLVLKAVAEVPGVNLCIIGAGASKDGLVRLSQELGISSRVRFCGEVHQAELIRYYNAADVTVLASSSEGIPNVVLESLACGTPVVATPVGGVPEVMTHPAMGCLLANRSVADIAAAIRQHKAKDDEAVKRVRDAIAGWGWEQSISRLAGEFRSLKRCRTNSEQMK